MKYKLLKAMAEERNAVKRETLTPPSSVESSAAGVLENGYPDHSSSDDESGIEDNTGTCDEAPLDFSVRRRSDSMEDGRSSESGSHCSAGEGASMGRMDTSPQPTALNLTNPDSSASNNRSVHLSPSQRHLVNGIKTEDLVGKIGEPQLALPHGVPGLSALKGFPPGFNLAAAAAAGILPNASGMLGGLPFNPAMIDNKKGQQNNSKPTRPFKAYPKDPLSLPLGYYGIPGMLPGINLPNIDPATAQAMSANTEELFNQYKLLMNHEKNGKGTGSKGRRNGLANNSSSPENSEPPVSPTSATSSNASLSPQPNPVTSPQPSQASPTSSSPVLPGTVPPPGPFTSPSVAAGAVKYNSQGPTPRKKPKMLPDEKKDSAYWERRRKNNDAAKRSRDARRAKEDEIAIRAAFLEQENLKLRVEVAALKNETAKLRCMLYNS